MIKGLYEAHLPVSNLKNSIAFYKKLGLILDHIVDNKIAFFGVEESKSWIGLWETDKVKIEYHPSIRHLAFQVELEDLKAAVEWLSLSNLSLWHIIIMLTLNYILMIQMVIVLS